MTQIKFPPFLTVEDEDEYGKNYEPIKKTITVRFGGHEIASYTLTADYEGEFFYEVEGSRWLVRYDGPEEFLAHKLRKLFALIEDKDKSD